MTDQLSPDYSELDKFKRGSSVFEKKHTKFLIRMADFGFLIIKLFLNKGNRIKFTYKRHVSKGNRLLNIADCHGAIECYNEAIDLCPKRSSAYFNRGLANYRLKNYDISIMNFDYAIKFSPKAAISDKWINPEDFKNKPGEFYYNEHGTAVQLLIPSFVASAYFQKGRAKQMLENYQEAISDYNKVLELKSDYKEAYYNRGLIKYELDDINGARLDWEIAGELGVSKAFEMIDEYCK